MTFAATGFGVAMLCVALAPTLTIGFVAMAVTGFAAICFMSTGNATLQLEATPSMRGRVMSLWAVGFMGSTPVGGPLVGWIVEVAGARSGLAVGGLSCLVAAAIGLIAMRKLHRRRTAAAMSPGMDEAFDSLSPLVSAESD